MSVVKIAESLKHAYVSALSEDLQKKIMGAVEETLRIGYPNMGETEFQQCREQAFNSRVCDLDGTIKIDFVKGELSFYVVENLRCQQDRTGRFKITRFEDLEDAITAYNALPKEYTSAIGGSLLGGKFGVGEIDFVHRKNGEDVLVNGFRFSERWKHPLVAEAIDTMIYKLHLQYESDVQIFGDKTVLVPLWRPEDKKLNSYFMDKYLRPKEGAEYEVTRRWGDPAMYSANHPMHTEHLLSAINEVHLADGGGWMKADEFFKKLHALREYDTPERMKISTININYVDLNGRVGQADIAPHQFALLKKQTIERTAQKPGIDEQINVANNIRLEQIEKSKSKGKTKETDKAKDKNKKREERNR